MRPFNIRIFSPCSKIFSSKNTFFTPPGHLRDSLLKIKALGTLCLYKALYCNSFRQNIDLQNLPFRPLRISGCKPVSFPRYPP